MLIKEIPIDERPRERLIRCGVSSLSNEDLLSIILKTGTRNKSVKELSLDIIKEIDGINNIKDITINKLLKINGIGVSKACEIVASIELGKRVLYTNTNKSIKLNNPKKIYNYIREDIIDLKQEYFFCLYLNTRNELIEKKILFIGTVNQSVVHPREVFKYAYLLSATSIICIHNHPSDDTNPSQEDISFTRNLVEIGKLQNIPILDHIVVGNTNYYSMNDHLNIFD